MVTKTQKSVASSTSGAATGRHSPLAGAVKDSAQQIWLAGLGAFAKAQEERGKVFEALVKEGLSIQRKTQSVAEEKITEATAKLATKATGINSRATGQWAKLEGIFEDARPPERSNPAQDRGRPGAPFLCRPRHRIWTSLVSRRREPG